VNNINHLLGIFEVEIKRGTLTLAILSQLRQRQYGYSLLAVLNDKNIDIEAGTLYPLLRRLEKQGILTGDWDTSESRPRKYYVLSEMGAELYDELKTRWHQQVENTKKILD
jgi:DNA-binding PadR family transcriptional regulator